MIAPLRGARAAATGTRKGGATTSKEEGETVATKDTAGDEPTESHTKPTSPITIRYSGAPVTVRPRRITSDMWVPNLGRNDPLQTDNCPGEVAALLFEQAKEAHALAIPSELRAECYGDDDADGAGFILAVYPIDGSAAGVTCGWRDVENIVCPAGDSRPDNDRQLVKEALEFMAGEMNAALGIQRKRNA